MVEAVQTITSLADIKIWLFFLTLMDILFIAAMVAWRTTYTAADDVVAMIGLGGVRTVRRHLPAEIEKFKTEVANTAGGVCVRAMIPAQARVYTLHAPKPNPRRSTTRLRRGYCYSVIGCHFLFGKWWLHLQTIEKRRRCTSCFRTSDTVHIGWLQVDGDKNDKRCAAAREFLEIVTETGEEAPQVAVRHPNDICYYCKQLGHWKVDCDLLKRNRPELTESQRASWVPWTDARVAKSSDEQKLNAEKVDHLVDLFERNYFGRSGRHFQRPEPPLTRAMMFADTVMHLKTETRQDWTAWDGKPLSIPYVVQLCEDADNGLLPYRVKGREPRRIKELRLQAGATLYNKQDDDEFTVSGQCESPQTCRVEEICKVRHKTVKAASVWWLQLEPKQSSGLSGWIELKHDGNPFDVLKPLHWTNSLRAPTDLTNCASRNFQAVQKLLIQDTSTGHQQEEIEGLTRAQHQQKDAEGECWEYSTPTNYGIGERSRSGQISDGLFSSAERKYVLMRRELLEQIGEQAPPETILKVQQSLLENRQHGANPLFRFHLRHLHEFLGESKPSTHIYAIRCLQNSD